MIEAYGAARRDRVKVVESLGRRRYHAALARMGAVVGNSSSGLVEVPSFHIPTVDIGIRQRGRTAGASVIHCGENEAEITRAIAHALSPEGQRTAREASNPYYRPDTPALITEAIATTPLETLRTKRFLRWRSLTSSSDIISPSSLSMEYTDQHIISHEATVTDALRQLNQLSGRVMTLLSQMATGVLRAPSPMATYAGDCSPEPLSTIRSQLWPTATSAHCAPTPPISICCANGARLGIRLIPELDADGRITDIIDTSTTTTRLPVSAILMAGGKGSACAR